MHLSDAVIDAATGGIVIPGQMQCEFEDPRMPEIVGHQHVLLHFDEQGMSCRAATVLDKLPSGLTRISGVEPSLQFEGLSRKVLERMLSPQLEAQDSTVHLEGLRCGTLSIGPHNNLQIGRVGSIEYSQRLDSEGRTFRVDGTLIELSISASSSSLSQKVGSFFIFGTIPWCTLRLIGFEGASRYHKYRQSSPEQGSTPAAPIPRTMSLSDLRCAGNGPGVLRAGSESPMLLTGYFEVRSHDKEALTPARDIIELDLTDTELAVRDADRARLRPDGFCDKNRSTFFLTIAALNASLLSGVFGADGTRATISMAGSGLGKLTYDTGLGRGHGDSLGKIRQAVKDLVLDAVLTPAGLEVSITGALREFDDKDLGEFNARFEETSKIASIASQKTFEQLMKPWAEFSINTVIPWLWLFIRRSPLARRIPID